MVVKTADNRLLIDPNKRASYGVCGDIQVILTFTFGASSVSLIQRRLVVLRYGDVLFCFICNVSG